MTARLIQVIQTDLLVRGKGTEDDPMRRITQYYSIDGELLAENDPLLDTTPVCNHPPPV